MTMDTGQNLILGKGMGMLSIKSPSTGIWGSFFRIGNITAMSSSAEVDTLDHYDSEHAENAKDFSVDRRVNPKITITTDEMSPENEAFADFAILDEVAQAAADNNTQALTNVMPGSYIPLNKKYIGIQTLSYDGGTGAFTVGNTVTGVSGATGVIVQIIGTTTAGVLYLKDRNAIAFVDDESITDTGTGAADVNGTETFLATSISLEDTDNPGTFLVAGTDFTVDSSMYGSIFIKTGGLVDGVTVKNLTAVYANAAGTLYKINSFTNTNIRARLWFTSDNTAGRPMGFITRDGKLRPAGDSSYIGDDFKSKDFEIELYPDYDNFPDSPYMEKIVYNKI